MKAVETGEIRVLPLDNPSQEPRVVWHPAEGSWAGVHDWFPDGDRLAVVVSASPTDHRIVTVSVASGEVRQIRSLPWSDLPQIRVSPSGRYIAYSRSESQEEPARDIYIVTADRSAETAIVRHAAGDELVDWGKDDGTLLISSDRDGQPGLWAVPLQDGAPAGPLELVMPNVDVGVGVGFSNAGSLYYPVRVSRRRLKMVELDLETGKLLSKPQDAVERFVGHNSNGVFSPDGKTFAYISERGGWNRRAIIMRTLSTGEERELTHELQYPYSLLWGPGGDGLLVQARDDRGRYGYFEVDLSDGSANLIAEGAWAGVLTPDGERLLHHTNQVEEGELRSYRFSDGSLETLRGDFGTARFTVSPDGRLATVHDGAEIRIHSTEGGPSHVLWRTDEAHPLGRWVVWTADGTTLVVLRRDPEAGEEMWRLWAVPADGSPPHPTELVHDLANAGARPIRFHPDGKTMLYNEGGYFWQIWAMRNLPAAGAAQRSN